MSSDVRSVPDHCHVLNVVICESDNVLYCILYRMWIPTFIVQAVLAALVVLVSQLFSISRQKWTISALLKELL